MTLSLSEIRARYIDYHTGDMTRHIDMSQPHEAYGDIVSFKRKTIAAHIEAEELGSGRYAKVYDIGNNRVLKVCEQHDKGYDAYIDACQKSNRNPHMPRVYYRGKWAGHSVYILEKLTPLVEDEARSFVVRYCERVIAGRITEVSPLLNPASFSPQLIEACETIQTLIQTREYRDDIHGGNIMLHPSSGRVVITDPIVHRG